MESRNPADLDDVVCEALLGDVDTFVDACRAARAAQRDWAAIPAPVRGNAIKEIGRLVEENKEALARLVTREIGKPYPESLGEVQEIVDTCDFFLSEGRRLYGMTVPSEMPDKQLFTFRNPVGVAAIVTAGNFPVAVPSWYIVPALLCGNAVVWKPAEYAPALGDALARLFLAGGPAGRACSTSCSATGPPPSPASSARSTSGSWTRSASPARPRWARASASCAAATCSRPASSWAARTRSWSCPTRTSTWPWRARSSAASARPASAAPRSGTVIVHRSLHDEFVARLTRAVEDAPIGDPSADVLYGPMIHERFLDRFLEWLELIEDHHTISGSSATGRITADNPRAGFVGDPEAGLFCHPDHRRRRDGRTTPCTPPRPSAR